jgi:hypothetical protein
VWKGSGLRFGYDGPCFGYDGPCCGYVGPCFGLESSCVDLVWIGIGPLLGIEECIRSDNSGTVAPND